jgi:tetratricopeptide (TPR) repeat protein
VLADLYKHDENLDQAAINFKKSVDLDSTNYQNQYFYGLCLCQGGKIQEGLNHIKESLKLKPDYELAINFLNKMGR